MSIRLLCRKCGISKVDSNSEGQVCPVCGTRGDHYYPDVDYNGVQCPSVIKFPYWRGRTGEFRVVYNRVTK